MRFDNAFLTVNGDVGMQFVDKGQVLSVYPDKQGTLQMTEEATTEQKTYLAVQYARRKNWYKKK